MLDGPPTTTDVLPLSPDGKPATKPVLFKLMEAHGWETDSALLPDAKLWAETGRFDKEGHALGARLAERLSAGIRDAADRILQLVRFRTKPPHHHGPWMAADAGRASSCRARRRAGGAERQTNALCPCEGESANLLSSDPLTWNPEVSVATATGARSFFASYEYAHGGVSPQECILPVLEVASAGPKRTVTILQTRWEGLRLRVDVASGADLRSICASVRRSADQV